MANQEIKQLILETVSIHDILNNECDSFYKLREYDINEIVDELILKEQNIIIKKKLYQLKYFNDAYRTQKYDIKILFTKILFTKNFIRKFTKCMNPQLMLVHIHLNPTLSNLFTNMAGIATLFLYGNKNEDSFIVKGFNTPTLKIGLLHFKYYTDIDGQYTDIANKSLDFILPEGISNINHLNDGDIYIKVYVNWLSFGPDIYARGFLIIHKETNSFIELKTYFKNNIGTYN